VGSSGSENGLLPAGSVPAHSPCGRRRTDLCCVRSGAVPLPLFRSLAAGTFSNSLQTLGIVPSARADVTVCLPQARRRLPDV
jgi:hypothetical protein